MQLYLSIMRMIKALCALFTATITTNAHKVFHFDNV